MVSKRKRRNKTFDSSLLNEFTRQFTRHNVYTENTDNTEHTLKSQTSIQAEVNKVYINGPDRADKQKGLQDLSRSSSTHSRKRSQASESA
jgi:hypothetical protein